LKICLDVGKIVTHALRVITDTCHGVIAVYVIGIDLTSHTGSLYEIFIAITIPLNNPKALEQMQKKTKSILEELDSLYIERDRKAIIETRASNLIETAIRLLEQIDAEFSAEQAENLQRKLLNAIRHRDTSKFSRSVRRTHADL
jgi:hypothetical protein